MSNINRLIHKSTHKIIYKKINESFIFLTKYLRCYKNDGNKYVFYRIVDIKSQYEYVLQCINSKAVFYIKINEVVFDIDILNALHPAQACYIGLEYIKYLAQFEKDQNFHYSKIANVSRYGKYELHYQNRNGSICFINKYNNITHIMNPITVASSKNIIKHFDASQSFYIGVLAGIKLNNNDKKKEIVIGKLTLVK